MSDLTITNAGVTVTPKSPGSVISTGRQKIIRVTPTCTTSALGSAYDVIFNGAEIPNAVREEGGSSKLIKAYVIDYTGALNDLHVVFHETSGIDIGPTDSSATANISDANLRLLKVTGMMQMDADNAETDLGGANIHSFLGHSLTSTSSTDNPIMLFPQLLQAASGKTSTYFSAMTGTAETFAADSLEFIFHIEY